MKKFIFPSGNRLCIHFPSLIPSVKKEQIYDYLHRKGFKKIQVDIEKLAREQIGKPYCRGSVYSGKTQTFDCSSFTQWIYGQKGIYIPRISIDQREFSIPVEIENLKMGDLVFTSGHINYYWEGNKDNSVGHVGIYTGKSIIHAANKKRGVVEDTLSDFLGGNFRGAIRIHEHIKNADTIIIPKNEKVEYDLHLRWRILQFIK